MSSPAKQYRKNRLLCARVRPKCPGDFLLGQVVFVLAGKLELWWTYKSKNQACLDTDKKVCAANWRIHWNKLCLFWLRCPGKCGYAPYVQVICLFHISLLEAEVVQTRAGVHANEHRKNKSPIQMSTVWYGECRLEKNSRCWQRLAQVSADRYRICSVICSDSALEMGVLACVCILATFCKYEFPS